MSSDNFQDTQLEGNGPQQDFNPFNFGGFNPFQGGVFSPDWGANLANQIRESAKNAQKYGGITTINGITTVTQNIGGRMYSAQLPPNSSVSTQSNTGINDQGQRVQTVVITVNGDVTVYTTVGGRTTVTDSSGRIRTDGGPFHISAADGSGDGNYGRAASDTPADGYN
ncbi:hypothetical protein Y032_0297g1724 [Ancylostoma ceylanicum]|uniref:Uncharacterized protein n=1 Tax=Ancylostoma ceylanicum TaxID=53326 RepID=A0A016S4R6_9BILA|nr:hypothetical protein Y032_0297g1724 [Ancylostoma ceylanicum]